MAILFAPEALQLGRGNGQGGARASIAIDGSERRLRVASRPSNRVPSVGFSIILSAGGFTSGQAIDMGCVSEDRSHDALVIGENPLGFATAEEPSRQGACTLGSRKG